MKRAALLVALLALPGCLTECGAIGHGVVGRGAVSDGAVGGGVVGGRPVSGATGIQWPSSGDIVFQVDADNPGASDLPVDNGSQSLGTFTASGSTDPAYTPAAGGVPSFWSYDGVDQKHTLTLSGTDPSDPDATAAFLIRPTTSSGVEDVGGSTPFLRYIGSATNIAYRWENLASAGVGEGPNNWHLVVFTYNGASDQWCELSTNTCSATGNYGTGFNLTSGTFEVGGKGGIFAAVDVHSITIWGTTVDGADIKTAINAAYPGLL